MAKQKTEVDYFLDCGDTPPNIHVTTSQRIDMAAAAAAYKVAEGVRDGWRNVEAKVAEVAEKIDKQNGQSSTWRAGLLRGLKQFIQHVDPEYGKKR